MALIGFARVSTKGQDFTRLITDQNGTLVNHAQRQGLPYWLWFFLMVLIAVEGLNVLAFLVFYFIGG